MSLDQRIEELEQESHRWMFANPERYRQVTTEMMQLSRGASVAARARAYRAQSNAFRMEGRWEEALRAAQQALRLWRKAGAEMEWARTQNTLIPILAQLGKTRRAMAASHAGLAVFLRLDQSLPAARLLNNTGGIYLYTGRPQEALHCYEQARALALKAGEIALAARTDMHWAMALQALGEHREALQRSVMALRPAARAKQSLTVARILVVAAISLFQLGRFGKALRRFAKARMLFERELATRDVAECELHICACYLELNRYGPALGRMESFLAEHGRAWFEQAWAWYYRGVALVRLGSPEEARIALGRAGRLFRQHGDRQGARRAGIEEAELLLQMGAAAPAAALATRLQRDEGLTSPLERVRVALVIAASALATGRLKRAAEVANQAAVLARRAHTPGLTFRALHLLGEVALAQRQFSAAHQYLTKAVQLAEQMRATVQLPFRQAFLADKAAAYADLVWLHLEQGQVAKAHRLVGKAKSRALADQLAAPLSARPSATGSPDEPLLQEFHAIRQEYQQLTLPTQLSAATTGGREAQPEGATARRRWLEQRLRLLWDEWELRRVRVTEPSKHPATGRRRARLRRGEAMVEYMVVRERLIAFVSDRSGLVGWSDLGPLEPVVRTLELLQLNLNASLNFRRSGPLTGLTKNANRLLHELHQRLWAPLPGVHGAERVVVVPHGPLHQLPFSALFNGQQYLIEVTELTLVPSRDVWHQCWTRTKNQQPAGDVVLGYSPVGQLPFVEAEAVAVAGQLATTAHVGEQARLARVITAEACRVLHLAVHGQFRPDNPDFSALQLADGTLTAFDVTGLRLRAALITLSACETGLSRVTSDDELIGLITAFLQAGSAAVLASLWRVDDQATADLMGRFYQGLLNGSGKAAALRGAQIALIDQRLHPLYWAAFAVVGEGGPIPQLITKGEALDG